MTELAQAIRDAAPGKTHLFAIGQAGYVLKSAAGTLVGVDLYLSDCVERLEGHMGFKRLLPKLLAPTELTFDALVATHPHYDHFDCDALPEMLKSDGTRLICSTGCGALAKERGIDESRVSLARPGDSFAIADVTVACVSCDHGEGAPDAFGTVLRADGKTVYMAGDTCLHMEYADALQAEFGGIDVMIAPINGAFGNMDELDCVRLARKIMPGMIIPCHYGMFASHGGSVGRFYELAKRAGLDGRIMLAAQGEHIII